MSDKTTMDGSWNSTKNQPNQTPTTTKSKQKLIFFKFSSIWWKARVELNQCGQQFVRFCRRLTIFVLWKNIIFEFQLFECNGTISANLHFYGRKLGPVWIFIHIAPSNWTSLIVWIEYFSLKWQMSTSLVESHRYLTYSS